MGRSGDTDGQDGGPAVPAAALASPEELDRMELALREVLIYAEPFARQQTDDEDEAEDALQDIGLDLWDRWTKDPAAFVAPETPEAYAYTVVRHYFVNLHKKQERWDKVIDRGADMDELEGEVAHKQDSPHDDVVVGRLQERIEALVDEMPERRRACWWGWFNGRSNAHIARELGITEHTVRNQIGKANKFLAPHLQRYVKEDK